MPYATEVVGESHYQAALAAICGKPSKDGYDVKAVATLVLEDSNPHDDQAVRVDIGRRTVGYLNRTDARAYRARVGRKGNYPARIRGGWDRGRDDKGMFGVQLDLTAEADAPPKSDAREEGPREPISPPEPMKPIIRPLLSATVGRAFWWLASIRDDFRGGSEVRLIPFIIKLLLICAMAAAIVLLVVSRLRGR